MPIAQIANVYNNSDAFTKKEKKIIKKYIPNIGKYNENTRYIDFVKHDFNQELYKKDSKQFWIIYFNGLCREPIMYINAFLDLNIPFWYPNASFPDPVSLRGYIEEAKWDTTYENNVIYEKYHNIATYNMAFMRLPLLNNFFVIVFPFWSLIICLYIALLKPKKEYIILLTVLFLLFGTYLLGPVSNFRYVYSFYLTLPLYLGIVLNNYLSKKNK